MKHRLNLDIKDPNYIYLAINMKHRLNLDIKDPNYILLKKIFKIIDSRKSYKF